MGALVAPLIGAALGGLGSLFGPKPQKQATSQTTNTSQDQVGAFNTTPNYDSFQQAYKQDIFNRLLGRMNSDPNLDGYAAGGLQQINQGSDARTTALSNILAARGLNTSPVAAAAIGSEQSNRIGQGVNLLNQIPLLKDELQRRNLTDYTNFFRSLPIGQTGSNSSQTNTSQHTEGNGSIVTPGGIGAATNSFGSILAGLYGSGAFNKSNGNGGNSSYVPENYVPGGDYDQNGQGG